MIPPPVPGDVVWFRNRGKRNKKPIFLVVSGPTSKQLERYEKALVEVQKNPELEIEYSARFILFSFDVFGPPDDARPPQIFNITSYLHDIVYANRGNNP